MSLNIPTMYGRLPEIFLTLDIGADRIEVSCQQKGITMVLYSLCMN